VKNAVKFLARKVRNIIFGDVEPVEIVIDISGGCNAFCPFCPRQLMDSPPSKMMEMGIFNSILSQVKTIKSIKIIRLYAVGEPMLHPHFDECVRLAKATGLKVNLSTNMSIGHKYFDALMLVDNVQFSVEGWNKETYEEYRKGLEFDSVKSNIIEFDRLIKQRRLDGKITPSRNINLLLTKKTNLDEFMAVWQKYADQIDIHPMYHMAIWDEEQNGFNVQYDKGLKDDYFEFSKKKYKHCSYPFSMITVNSSGNLALCCSDFSYKLSLGDYKNLYLSFTKSPELNRIRNEFRSGNPVTCIDCQQFYKPNKDELYRHFGGLLKYEKQRHIKIHF
jgi:wyosine [tRNA(Phe)-imidazoG37] synthetase (radical SAM superfamily)